MSIWRILRCRVGSSETCLIGPTALRPRPSRSLSCASMKRQAADAGKEGQWPGLVEGEPHRRTGAVRQHLLLGKTRPGHHAAVLDFEPAPPMRRFDIPDVGDTRIGDLALQRKDGRRNPPPR